MVRFLISTFINALGLWAVTTLIPAITLQSYWGTDLWPTVGSYLLVGAIFGFITAIIAPVVKVLAFPLFLLTFGLISLVINGALLLFVAWVSNLIHGGGLQIAGFVQEGLSIEALGFAILGALVMSIATFISRWFFKLTGLLG